MKIASIQFPVFVPYNKPTLELYVSGCTRGCSECHNPELADFEYGSHVHTIEYLKIIQERSDLFDAIAFTGGDLLCQDALEAETFATLLSISCSSKELWLFTGEESIDNVPKWAKELFHYIKIGPYKKELAQPGFPASSNQKLLKKGIDY